MTTTPTGTIDLSQQARVRVARLLLASGFVTAAVWLSDLVPALLSGEVPDLHGSTTAVTYALDIGVIAPAAVIAGVLVRRGVADGYRVALPLLVLEVSLLPMIALQTILQLAAGISLQSGEVVGPVAGFAVFAVLAARASWLLVRGAAGTMFPPRGAVPPARAA
jgi:hypothetical protein